MTAIAVAAAIAVFLGGALQSATGFGFALVSAPLVFAWLEPEESVGVLLLLSFEVNLLTLATERRRPQPLVRQTVTVLLCSLPGLAVGILVLRSIDDALLQVLVTVAVFASLGAQHLVLRGGGTRRLPHWAPPVAGLAAGALTTSTTTSGPPLVLMLIGRGSRPEQIRDTLTVCFLSLGALGGLALLVSGTEAAVPDGVRLAVLVPLVVVGHLAGRRIFARLAVGAYERVLVAVLVVSAVAGLIGALA